MKTMPELIPWRPWMTDQHAQSVDTHSSWAFLANSAANSPLPSETNGPPRIAQPRAHSHLLNPHRVPGSAGKAVALCYHASLSDRGQKRKERTELITVPWRTPTCLPWAGIKRATEGKPLALPPSGPLHFVVRFHQIQRLLIFSLPQRNAPWNKVLNIYFLLLLILLCPELLILTVLNESNYWESSISIKFRQVNDCLPLRAEQLRSTGIPLPTRSEKAQWGVRHSFRTDELAVTRAVWLLPCDSEIPSVPIPIGHSYLYPQRTAEFKSHSQGQKFSKNNRSSWTGMKKAPVWGSRKVWGALPLISSFSSTTQWALCSQQKPQLLTQLHFHCAADTRPGTIQAVLVVYKIHQCLPYPIILLKK